MSKRNQDAMIISDGACNPRAIVSAMQRAVNEMVDAGLTDTDTLLADPALKLMTHQLAFLQGIPTAETQEAWVEWRNACNGEDA